MTAGARPVRAPRGTDLTCRGWPQEAAYRMLQNNLDPEVAERPDDLVVYGGTGRAARSWDAFDAMCRTLTTLAGDETMLVQSGKPVGVFRTHEWAPRVLIANSNLVPEWANWEEFRRLEALGLTMYGQMTAGSWIYIGTQGILQGTYECFAEIARRRFGGTLAGTITLTAGLGGMGGAQPLAVTMNDGVALCIEVDAHRIERRLETAYLDERRRLARRRDRPLRASPRRSAGALGRGARQRRRARAAAARPGIPGRHRDRPDERPRPAQLRARRPHAGGDRRDGAHRARRADPPRAGEHGHPLPGDGRVPRPRQRGLRLRQQPARRGPPRRLRPGVRLPGLPPRLHPPAVLRGQGTVPVGRALGRPGRHRGDRPGRARGVPRRRTARPVDPDGRRTGRLPGPPGADLLARLRRAAPPRAAVQRDGAARRAERADRDRTRSPRLRIGRVARTARPRR